MFTNILHNIVCNLAGQDLSRYFQIFCKCFANISQYCVQSGWSGFEQIFPGLQPRLLTLEVRIDIGYSLQDFFCFTYACVDRSTLLLKDKVLKNFKEFVEVPCLQFRLQEIQIVRILWKNFKDSNKHSSHQRICLYQCKHSVEFWMSPLLNLSTPGSDSTKKFQNGHCTGFPE